MAGPWVDDQPGHGFAVLSYTRYQATDYFVGPGQADSNGNPQKPGIKLPIKVPYPGGFLSVNFNSNYIDQAASFYGEVSLYKHLGLTFAMPLVRYVTQDVAATDPFKLSQLNAGDLVAGIKYQIPPIKALRGFAFGPQVYFTAPSGDVNGRAAYPASTPLAAGGQKFPPLPMPTGNGTADIEARGSFGYSFYPIPLFATADVGYHHHFDDASCTDYKGDKSKVKYSDDLPWSVQVGGTWSPKKKWFDHASLIATVHGVHSFENGDVPGEHGVPTKTSPFLQTCGQANNQTFLSFGGTLLLFPIKWFGLSYSIEHTLTGINTGYGLTNSIGLATQF